MNKTDLILEIYEYSICKIWELLDTDIIKILSDFTSRLCKENIQIVCIILDNVNQLAGYSLEIMFSILEEALLFNNQNIGIISKCKYLISIRQTNLK